MARTTKLELQQALATMGEEVQRLRIKVSALRADNDRLLARLAEARSAEHGPLPDANNDHAYQEAMERRAERMEQTKRVECVTPARAAYLERRAARSNEPTPFQLACAAAREMAMRGGRVVRVGA